MKPESLKGKEIKKKGMRRGPHSIEKINEWGLMRRGPHSDLTTLINDLSVKQFGTEFAGVWSDIVMHHILT